jgi:hypothetical protein
MMTGQRSKQKSGQSQDVVFHGIRWESGVLGRPLASSTRLKNVKAAGAFHCKAANPPQRLSAIQLPRLHAITDAIRRLMR